MNTNVKENASKRNANSATRNAHKFAEAVIENITNPSTGEEVEEVNTNQVLPTEETPTAATTETVAEVIPTTETPIHRVSITTNENGETEVKRVLIEVPKVEIVIPLSLEKLREKGKSLYMLGEKWEDVKSKQEHLRSFQLTHQTEQAKIVLTDADGRTFSSSNAKAIAKFIEYCGEQFEISLTDLETEIRKIS